MQRTVPLLASALLAVGFPIPAQAEAPGEGTEEGRADGEAAPKPPSVEAPTLLDDPGVVYPPAALEAGFYDSVTVELVLELDIAGNVVRASVPAAGRAELDAAALGAARTLRFTPARRDGIPIAARIKFRYAFEAPAPLLSVRVVDADSTRALAQITVVVTTADGATHRLVTGADGLARADELPRGKARLRIEADGYAPEALAVELVPGKESRVELSLGSLAPPPAPTPDEQEIVVRGERRAPAVSSLSREEVRQIPGAFGDPFRAIETMPGVTPIASGLPFFYVRGAPPGNVGYFLDDIRVPYLYHIGFGPSVIHPGLVDRVDLYPGGYPARFGRFAGGIVAADTTRPDPITHGEGNVRLFDAGALVESGFADGRGTVLAGARYSYTAALLTLLSSDVVLDYRDYQARASYDLTSKDKLTLFGFGSYDLLGEIQEEEVKVLLGTEFYRLSLRHDHRLDDGALVTSATIGFDQSRVAGQGNVTNRSLAVKSGYEKDLEGGSLLRAGADFSLEAFRVREPVYVDPDDPETDEFKARFPPREDIAAGMWVDSVLEAAPGVEVVPGVRVDVYRSGSASAVALDPRIAARFKVTPRLRIIHAYGIAHQPPAFAIPVPGLTPSNLEDGLQSSFQTSAGVEYAVMDDTVAKGNVFYNAFFDMTDAFGAGGGPDGVDRANGSGVGLELQLHRDMTKDLGGFISYTLSRSLRSVGREHFYSEFDRTHVLNVALGYDLGRNWRAGGRYVFYTGTPIYEGGDALRSTHDVERTPPFHRVDVRLEKRWNLAESAWLSFVAEGMNVTLSKETIEGEVIGPVSIPSVGVEGGF
jgi:TonB family protein